MNIEEFRGHCMSVKGASESLPFIDPNVLVFKVMDKMFAWIHLAPKDGVFRASLKCDPARSVELREKYRGVAGTQFKTLMWNDVVLESDVPDELIEELVRHSADQVIRGLTKKKREEYEMS